MVASPGTSLCSPLLSVLKLRACWLSVAFVLCVAGIANTALAKDDPNPLVAPATLSQDLPPECKTELAQRLALVSIHANDPELEANLDLATHCGKLMTLVYEQAVANRDQTRMRGDNIGPIEGLINFESPHVHPIDMTPDGTQLLVVNTAAHRLEVFSVAGNNLSLSASIPVGIDPVSVRARNNSEAWVVNHVSDSVSVIDLDSETVIATLDTDNEPADVVFAGNPQRAFVSASEANRLNVFNPANLAQASQQVSINGEDPRALAVSANGQQVYVGVFESGNNTGIVANSGFSGGGTIVRGVGLADNDVAIVDAASLSVVYRRGLMNLVMAMDVHPVTGQVHVVGTEALNEIATEPALNGLFLRVNSARFNAAAGTGGTTADLNPHLDYQSATVSNTLRTQSIGDPRGIAWRNNGQLAFITGMGSNNVIVINGSGQRVNHFAVGQGPTGIVLNDAQNLGYVLNKFDGSVSVINLSSQSEIRQVDFDDPTPQVIKDGRPILYDTHLTSGTGHLSCASCHADGRTDRLGWQLSNASAPTVSVPRASNSLPGNVIGSTTLNGNKNVMTTQTLLDIMEHPRFHWRGDRESIDDFNGTFTNLMGRSSQISAAQMDDFKEFLRTLWLQPNPYRNLDNSRPTTVTLPDGSTATSNRVVSSVTDALRGGGNSNNCLICHSGQGNATRNFGANPEIGSNVIAPALPALYDKMGSTFGRSGFGFFHNGAADLFEASRTREFLSEILTLEGPEGPLVGDEIRQAPHAGVGRQVTVSGNITTAQNQLLQQFVTIADNSAWAELIAHARVNNRQRGFAMTSASQFESDITGENATLNDLLAIAQAGSPVTFTLVATGMSVRLALDSDLDGERNNDGVQNESPTLSITSPANGSSFVESALVSLTASANDPEDGDLSDDIQWSSSLDGNLGSISSTANLSVGAHLLTASVVDSEGAEDSDSVSITIEQGLSCGAPDFDAATDRALIVWQDCDGTINVVGAGGNASARYVGKVGSLQPLSNVVPDSIEASDTVVQTSAGFIDFDMTLGGIWTDGFSYTTSAGASSCLALTSQAAGTTILAGNDRVTVTAPFDPETLEACTLPPDTGCNLPSIDPSQDGGFFVWTDCAGAVQMLLTGIEGQGTVAASGSLSSSLGINSVTPISLETSDSVTQVNNELMTFDTRTSHPWSDQIAVGVTPDSELCVSVDSLSGGVTIFAGADKTPVTSPFDPVSLSSCAPVTSECQPPDFDAASERALFTWFDCAGDLHVLGTGAEAGARYAGQVYASPAFSNVEPRSVEATDTVDASDPAAVGFDLTMGGGPWFDEIVMTGPGSAICIDVSLRSAGTQLLAGSNRTPVTSPFDPATLQSCTPPGTSDCGNPAIDPVSDAGLFVWKNCTGEWSLMITGIEGIGGVNYIGSITSSSGFSSITPRSTEASDALSTALNAPLTFNLVTGHPWEDQFDFVADENADLCVTISSQPAGSGLFAGEARVPVGVSFNPVTFASCN